MSASPGVTNVACVASNDLFQGPFCSLRRVGAADDQSIMCSKPKLYYSTQSDGEREKGVCGGGGGAQREASLEFSRS